MANLAAALKEEMARLARKVVKADTKTLHSNSAAHRRHIAALRRQIATLDREVAALRRTSTKGAKASAVTEPSQGTETKYRISAKGLKSIRDRLGISQEDLALLVGVSAQTIYNWEKDGVSNRQGRREAVAALRSVGKREVAQRLDALKASKLKPKPRRKRRAAATK